MSDLPTEHQERIIGFGREAVEAELQSLAVLPERIGSHFAQAVEHIRNSDGRLIISGIGKSAIIAQKIVATLNSTGTPAVFMHAADAIHGDLGLIQRNDTVLLISKSGNTPEIKALIPLIQRFGNRLIGMTGNANSELARASDLVLNVEIDREACPNNLAPTTSTTAQLLMGDALSIALLKLREFSSEDFSRYHPGGSLGRQLYLTAGEIAARNEKPAVEADAPVRDVIGEITGKRLGATAVTDGNKLAGIITDGDIRRMLEKHSDLSAIRAADIMSSSPFTAPADMLAVALAEQIRERKISQVIVLDSGKYAGMVHIHDLNKEGIF
jgi:arabinose-5-phosphate isomerase